MYRKPSSVRTQLGPLAVVVLAGASTLAFAQPSSSSFASTFAEMQALSSNSSQWQQQTPSFSRQAATPHDRVSLGDYQALSSNSSQWQPDQGGMPVDNAPAFARTHPRGIPFAEYQALASNSGEYQMASAGIGLPLATADSRHTSLRDRLAAIFGRSNATPANDN